MKNYGKHWIIILSNLKINRNCKGFLKTIICSIQESYHKQMEETLKTKIKSFNSLYKKCYKRFYIKRIIWVSI